MSKQWEREKPFQLLRRMDGSEYSDEIILNWYKARAYVLDKLRDVAIGPNSGEHLHVVVICDCPLMLSVARQVALSAHYANFEEHDAKGTLTCCNRTVITIVSQNENIVEELKKEEYLCNLLDLCKYSVFGVAPVNKDSYLDIEFEIVKDWQGKETEFLKVMTAEDVEIVLGGKEEQEIESIDTRKAVLANRMYKLGELIDNLPAEDIHCAHRYVMALDVFQHDLLRKPIEGEKRGGVLSNVFCADCFESRAKGIKQYCEEKNKERAKNKEKKMKEEEAWEECNEALSKSEHARWVVEKLILGFRPLNDDERWEDERRFGSAKQDFRKQLKKRSKDPAHIDLCSYADLRRISPDDLKFDSFLMLAIPKIMRKVENNSLCSAKRLRKHARTN